MPFCLRAATVNVVSNDPLFVGPCRFVCGPLHLTDLHGFVGFSRLSWIASWLRRRRKRTPPEAGCSTWQGGVAPVASPNGMVSHGDFQPAPCGDWPQHASRRNGRRSRRLRPAPNRRPCRDRPRDRVFLHNAPKRCISKLESRRANKPKY